MTFVSSESQGKFQSGQEAFREYNLFEVEFTLLPIYPAPYIFPIIPTFNGTARSAHVMRDDLPNLCLGWSCMCAVGRETYLSSDSSSTFSLIVWLFYTTE